MKKNRIFIRFGEFPDDCRSRIWKSPHYLHTSKVNSKLPGISVYEVTEKNEKLSLVTTTINLGCGLASLNEHFHQHTRSPDLPIYLVSGRPVRWVDLDDNDRSEFRDFYPGSGYHAKRYDLEGSDGEPMLREYKIIRKISVWELECELISFPSDYHDLENTITKPTV